MELLQKGSSIDVMTAVYRLISQPVTLFCSTGVSSLK